MIDKNNFFSIIYHFVFAITSSVVGAVIASWPLLMIFVLVQKTYKVVNLSIGQIMGNYNQLLWYLIWPLKKKLRMSNLPTSMAAAQHFADVKKLFTIVIIAFLCCLILYFWNSKSKKSFFRLNKICALLLLLLPVAALPFALTNFDQFFINFHHLFFIGSTTWLFNPETDPIINLLTEGFFAACFAVGGTIYELYFANQLLQR
ncbi:integral membrane protein TIGR01906 [Lactobacillus bombicola]|jgi:integral membrane protein (TIGR01906 family)|uniref:Integral membrane protein TIGR01906 n=1 Tax=Lactobacillus bombicola TaxID=1505723 RepID=A0A1I1T6L7_9LACO|nr:MULTISPECIES: TIGR01906 family membrane protein [Lactobacillus]RHW49275.1 TIGR01906 family membrane protein [Lactobacillus bombicola]RHW53913.1 TIGR01906 family membrane protein [Lactobacillus bombicola]RMC41312.1 TIGR01906 family membrane protein [Lactobacillus sp. ESL0237]RMC45181.1 TIGR01906 family membrane protein [Lactobacillus sp. ESL0234]RMC46014.1 TIGR01906 family membrane protein [Lactobacillus sp. ESL0236]